jgi:hypothetical protein
MSGALLPVGRWGDLTRGRLKAVRRLVGTCARGLHPPLYDVELYDSLQLNFKALRKRFENFDGRVTLYEHLWLKMHVKSQDSRMQPPAPRGQVKPGIRIIIEMA